MVISPTALATLATLEAQRDIVRLVALSQEENDSNRERPYIPFIPAEGLENPYESHAERACRRAFQQWTLGVKEPTRSKPNGAKIIDSYIREDMGWTWLKPYRRNRDSEWCGAFCAHCHDQLKPEIRQKIIPSTYRLWENWHNRPDVCLPLEEARPGDLLVVGPSTRQAKSYGHHICLVYSVELRNGILYAKTIEGNAHGLDPSGKIVEGVVYQERQLTGDPPKLSSYVGKWLYRPTEDMYTS